MSKRQIPTLATTALLLFSLICPLTVSAEEPLEYEVGMSKGLSRLDAEQYDEAAALFRDILKTKPGDLRAQLMLAIALNRKGELAEAEAILTVLAEKQYEPGRTYYELGVIAYKRENFTASRDYFKKAEAASPERKVGVSITDFFSDIARRKETKRFSLQAGLGAQYDTNVSLRADEKDPIVKYNPWKFVKQDDDKSDVRAVFTFSGNLVVSRAPAKLTAGYSFYQSLHRRLSEFDLAQHAITLKTSFSPVENILIGADYLFAYSFLDGDDYARSHTLRPYVRLTFLRNFPTKLVVGYTDMNFNNSDDDSANSERSGFNTSVGIEQSVNVIENLFLTFGYYYDNNNTQEGLSSYSGNRYFVAAFYDHNNKWTAGAKAEYYDRNYHRETKYPGDWFWTAPCCTTGRWGWPFDRDDITRTFDLYFTKPLSSIFTLGLGETYIANSSSEPLYDYKRSITTIFLTARF